MEGAPPIAVKEEGRGWLTAGRRPKKQKATLALADGAVFTGWAVGYPGIASGEVVFNTGLTGYQEIITDPSYSGQLVVLTVPHVGNCGVNEDDAESARVQAAGVIVREACRRPSNWRSRGSLEDLLRTHRIPAIEGVDTRALTRRIRDRGCQMGVIAHGDHDHRELVEMAATAPPLEGRDLTSAVAAKEPYQPRLGRRDQRGRLRVAVVDLGLKGRILDLLAARCLQLEVFPPWTSPERILETAPDGVVLSNGPGDPSALPYAAVAARRFFQAGLPVFGICLGHQVLALALGGETFKLTFGHHGTNHPVKDLLTGRVFITSQNHNYCVDPASLPEEVEVTQLSLYDGTVEALAHRYLPIVSVQYHPEASPGPHDAEGMFDRFIAVMEQARCLVGPVQHGVRG